MGERVAISHDGELIVHAGPAAGGGYDTLCGVDGDDESIGLKPAKVPYGGRARITCEQCRSIWDQATRYSSKDFAP